MDYFSFNWVLSTIWPKGLCWIYKFCFRWKLLKRSKIDFWSPSPSKLNYQFFLFIFNWSVLCKLSVLSSVLLAFSQVLKNVSFRHACFVVEEGFSGGTDHLAACPVSLPQIGVLLGVPLFGYTAKVLQILAVQGIRYFPLLVSVHLTHRLVQIFACRKSSKVIKFDRSLGF